MKINGAIVLIPHDEATEKLDWNLPEFMGEPCLGLSSVFTDAIYKLASEGTKSLVKLGLKRDDVVSEVVHRVLEILYAIQNNSEKLKVALAGQ